MNESALPQNVRLSILHWEINTRKLKHLQMQWRFWTHDLRISKMHASSNSYKLHYRNIFIVVN